MSAKWMMKINTNKSIYPAESTLKTISPAKPPIKIWARTLILPAGLHLFMPKHCQPVSDSGGQSLHCQSTLSHPAEVEHILLKAVSVSSQDPEQKLGWSFFVNPWCVELTSISNSGRRKLPCQCLVCGTDLSQQYWRWRLPWQSLVCGTDLSQQYWRWRLPCQSLVCETDLNQQQWKVGIT